MDYQAFSDNITNSIKIISAIHKNFFNRPRPNHAIEIIKPPLCPITMEPFILAKFNTAKFALPNIESIFDLIPIQDRNQRSASPSATVTPRGVSSPSSAGYHIHDTNYPAPLPSSNVTGKCASISPNANISFYLAQLEINDKIMNDHIKIHKDALSDDDIFKNFSSIQNSYYVSSITLYHALTHNKVINVFLKYDGVFSLIKVLATTIPVTLVIINGSMIIMNVISFSTSLRHVRIWVEGVPM